MLVCFFFLRGGESDSEIFQAQVVESDPAPCQVTVENLMGLGIWGKVQQILHPARKLQMES